jgi:hypothetical protein
MTPFLPRDIIFPSKFGETDARFACRADFIRAWRSRRLSAETLVRPAFSVHLGRSAGVLPGPAGAEVLPVGEQPATCGG